MKDKLKKVLCGVLFCCSMPALVACTGQKPLATPTDVSIDETTHVVSWQAVDEAEYYIIEINGKSYQTTTTSFPADDIFKNGGTFYVRVQACDRHQKFLSSEFTTFVSYKNLLPFDAPVLSYDNLTLSWDGIEGAEYYCLLVNNVKFETTQTSLCFANLDSQSEIYSAINFGEINKFQVYVKSTSNNLKSDNSNTVECFVADVQQKPENLEIQNADGVVTLSFDTVASANTYTIKIDNKTLQTSNNVVDITSHLTDFKNYTISVKCDEVKQTDENQVETILYMESLYTSTNYEHKPYFVDKKVQNIGIEGGVLQFDDIRDTKDYVVTIKNTKTQVETEYYIQQNQINIVSLNLEAGNYQVTVRATNSGYYSLDSEAVNYLVQKHLSAPKISINKDGENYYLNIVAVQNATGYQVLVSPYMQIFTTDELVVDISNYLQGGTNTISVLAKGDGDIYLDSLETNINQVLIGTPENLKVESGILSFNAVTEADGYEIVINENVKITTSNNSVDISTYISSPNIYNIKVRAVFGEEFGKFANLPHTTTQQLSAPTNLNVVCNEETYTLSFDVVDDANASKYDVYINSQLATSTTENSVDISLYLSLGENEIYVVTKGDDTIYLDSKASATKTYIKTLNLSKVSDIEVYAELGKYYLSFAGVDYADSYEVTIANSQSGQVFNANVFKDDLLNQTAIIEISSAISESDNYTISVEANSSVVGVLPSNNVLTENIKSYNIAEYQNESYFYNGKNYTYCINSAEELKTFVFYAVLYRLSSAEVYIKFDYDNKSNAYTSTDSPIDQYLPCLSQFGVDISNGDVLSQLFKTENLSKLQEIITFIEQVHDQIYLYYDVSSCLTSQKSDCVYTLNFEYVGNYEATNVNTKPSTIQANLPLSYSSSTNTRNFAIDSLEYAPAETVAQLLMVVQNGRQPQFVSTDRTANQLVDGKTIAQQTYEKAREILSDICTDDMSDYQKALAIYEWIITNNNYDSTTFTSATGAPFSEENLSEMSFYASGMLLNNLAVCKGIAQAFALMCNIEGIKTVETFGIVGSGIDWQNVDWTVGQQELMKAACNLTSDAKAIATYNLLKNINNVGAHSWNRIYLDAGEGERWYIVDATWADLKFSNVEYLSHNYFLVNDDYISDNRKEFYPNGQFYKVTDSSDIEIDFSASGNYNYYKDTTHKYNSYITEQSEINAVVANMSSNNHNGFEIMFDEAILSEYQTFLQEAFVANGLDIAEYTVKKYGQYVFVVKI